jgi:hypothetical protein
MRDEEAQFFVAVADLCTAASVAAMTVEILLESGRHVAGVPAPVPAAGRAGEELDDSGYTRTLFIDGTAVDLGDVRRCCLIAP